MFFQSYNSIPLKVDQTKTNWNLVKQTRSPSNNGPLFRSKNANLKFSTLKSVDIASRLGQFAWRQIVPSNIILPVIFRHQAREEYLCVQMIRIHVLSRLSPETVSYWMHRSPIRQFILTKYEAELLHHINKYHSNGILENNHRLDYSRLETATITPFLSFLQFYQLIYSINLHQQNYIPWNLSATCQQLMKDPEKQVVNTINDPSKILSKSIGINNSFCRQMTFHGKQILSYCTTSANRNEKDKRITSCLSVKDIVTLYFPWSSIEQFIQICRERQITRFKPDRSTSFDSTLRLVNIQELENHWNSIFKELVSHKPRSPVYSYQISIDEQSNKDDLPIESTSSSMTTATTRTNATNEILLSHVDNHPLTKNDECHFAEELDENCSVVIKNGVEKKNHENLDELNNCSTTSNDRTNKSYEISEQENLYGNDLEKNKFGQSTRSFLITEQNSCSKFHYPKKHRRRRALSYYPSKKRRKQKQTKAHLQMNHALQEISNDNEQCWIKKFSIEPISIIIDRYRIPTS